MRIRPYRRIQLHGTAGRIVWAFVLTGFLWAAWHGELRWGDSRGHSGGSKLPAIKEIFRERGLWPYNTERDEIPQPPPNRGQALG